MNNVKQRDGFDLALAAIPACSLDRRGARAQKERLRAITPHVTNVREDAMTVLVEFAASLDATALEEAIEVEQHCCGPVLGFEFDRPNRSLRVSATDPAAASALQLIAAGLSQRPPR